MESMVLPFEGEAGMYPQILFHNRKPDRILDLAEYRDAGGYAAMGEVLKGKDPSSVIDGLMDAGLLGRGGAGFPIGQKLSTVLANAPHPRYVVCNADEMEPGTFKDRVLLHASPHQLIEGMVIAAYAMRARHGIVFIRREYENAARILDRETGIARQAGLLGENINTSGFDFDIVVHRSGGRYICGEGTAILNAIEGRRANPRKPPPFATFKGLWQLPTLVQNVETLCYVPHVIKNGAEWFRSLAATAEGAGTKLFSVSGRVRRPGCYELPMGIRLSEIIEDVAGGMQEGSEFKACLPGGASTHFMPRSMYHAEMDFKALADAGYRLGTGAIMVFDQKTCLVAATLNLIEFFTRESCGWCTPCREGLPYIRDLLTRIEGGDGKPEYIGILSRMCEHLSKAYCAFAPGAAAPVESLLQYFEEEVEAHIENKGCPFSRT
jgi:NADH-quinone oxidoreductase subunit F